MKLVKDPVHGYITLSEEEVSLLDTRAVQRLRRISQLPLVYLVYPGARHSRFDHSLGCMFLAGEFAEHLRLDKDEKALVRASALLHDVGHTPFSHLLEELLIENGVSHEEMSVRVIQQDEEVSTAVEGLGSSVKEVVNLLRGGSRLSGLVSGPLDVDRLDFLVRDAYFSGATYGVVDVKRIIRLTKLLDDGPAVDSRGMGAVEELAIARYHSFINIYFHHTVRAAQILLLRAALKLSGELNFAEMPVEEYLGYDDLTTWCLMKNKEQTRGVVERLERRILPRTVFERQYFGDMGPRFSLRERMEVESEIADQAGADPSKVFVDFSYAPPLTKYGPGEIRIHPSTADESWILKQLSKPLNVVRVYVEKDVQPVDRVRKAAEEILSKPG
ncbi:MAG: HD domain-containing protein [Candidatus Caldarchaeum sp.]|nr:HD domain-containing protein [Candidatus Caldarchaeum sp.]MCS7137769.1 HD domain-containing protein [Candidatus Caldarchaeum sp.]MDW8359278.1 HD domain-containing protein [Candidatus Caldarchaeum sp.]